MIDWRANSNQEPHCPMTDETRGDASTPAAAVARVRISCPGCGRHDYVRWPADQIAYHWKCFNCGKEFDLTRDDGH